MIVVTGTIELEAEHVWPATTAAAKMIEASRAEEGCITYCFYVDITETRRFRVYEEWESDDALQAHFATPHMAEFREAMKGFRIISQKIMKYEVNSVQGL